MLGYRDVQQLIVLYRFSLLHDEHQCMLVIMAMDQWKGEWMHGHSNECTCITYIINNIMIKRVAPIPLR